MSDIHGESDRFYAMLEKINFSEEDTLYIIGDIIDRKPGGIELIMDIMNRPNVHMILGNHEDLCVGTLGEVNIFGARQMWEQNGGECTRMELLNLRTLEERAKILNYLSQLPDHIDIEVDERRFHLVHGGPGKTKEDRIWGRPKPGASAPIPNVTVIVGHTPTVYLAGDDGQLFRIWYGDGIIDIDCGCGNETALRRLACLRLDDMAEFYI